MTFENEGRICYKCDYETDQPLNDCPRCGQRLRTAQQVRKLGWVLAAAGVFLTIFMIVITVIVGNAILQSDRPAAGARFTGGPGMMIFIFVVFGAVLTFGLTSFAAGVWQIKHGRRNRRLTKIILALAVVFLAAGVIARALN
ncbi:MAG: hypothetical protein ACREAB_00350 [Blastocatellia bacterium]